MSNISLNNLSLHEFVLDGEIQTHFGFFKFYFNNLNRFPDRETCFNYCNAFFKEKYGYLRFATWFHFKGL